MGLSYIHDQGLTHCNIRSSNILFTDDLLPRIGDFGYANYSNQDLK